MITSVARYFRNFFESQVQGYTDLVNRIIKEKPSNQLLQEEYYSLDAMDTKCAGLLTHVSLMIAATVFLYTDGAIGQQTVSKDLLLLEIFAYIIAALSLLFCLDLMALSYFKKHKDLSSIVTETYVKRLLIYRSALRLTVATTIAVLVTLAWKRILS